MAHPKIIYNLAPFQEQQKRFYVALSKRLKEGSAFPIIEVLTLLPIRFANEKDRQALLKRGNGQFDFSGGTYTNTAKTPTSVTFDDYLLGKIDAVIPQTLSFSATDGQTITLNSVAEQVKIAHVENLSALPQKPPFPLTVRAFVVGEATMVTSLADAAGEIITIDGQIRSALSQKALNFSGGADEFCEKDWVLLQDNTSRRCVVQRSNVSVRRYPVVSYHDTKDEAVRAARNSRCNGIQVND